MTLFDLDVDTIQHLDFDLGEPVPCSVEVCDNLADFKVSTPCRSTNLCGRDAKGISDSFKRTMGFICRVCKHRHTPDQVTYTPIH
jgi:hypothetical protein